MRVLMAEDDVRLSTLLVQGLTEAGWVVDAVTDVTQAYHRALADDPPDVLLLDWMLPGMDGLTVCRRLREMGVTTPVPAGAPEVTFTFHLSQGVGPSKPVTLEMPA
jgi:DNA-binding response OmpR family regulator